MIILIFILATIIVGFLFARETFRLLPCATTVTALVMIWIALDAFGGGHNAIVGDGRLGAWFIVVAAGFDVTRIVRRIIRW